MNIKKIYPVTVISAVLMIAARALNLLFGTEMPSGLTLGNFFSFIFLIVSIISFGMILFVSKFSYGVSKLTELNLKSNSAPAFFILGLGFIGDFILSIKNIKDFNILPLIPSVLALLSAIATFLFGLAILKNSKKSGVLLMVFPVLYYASVLIKIFFTKMSSLSNTNAGVLTFKVIFILLFFLYFLSFLIDPENLKGAGSVVNLGCFSAALTLSVIIPSIALYFYDKANYHNLLRDISLSDFGFVIFSLTFVSVIIKAITEKSNSLKAKVSEEP